MTGKNKNNGKNPDSISLHLSIDEVNAILNALGDRPYVQVFGLIQKIQQQAGAQIGQEHEQAALTAEEVANGEDNGMA